MATLLKSSVQLLLLTCIGTTVANAHTAVLFGASGAVGSEVLHALLRQPFWEKVILVGRRWPTFDNKTGTILTQIELPDLNEVDRNERLRQTQADACIIALGVGSPHHSSLHYWHSVEVEMTAKIASLCKEMQVQYISLLSAVDSDSEPNPYSAEDLKNSDGPIGWWGMLTQYSRMKGLAEHAVASAGIAAVRLIKPSNIVTETTRYGWFDWTVFKITPLLDRLLPEYYHSVPVKLLGTAMAGDAEEVLSKDDDVLGVSKLTYADYIRIVDKISQEQMKAKIDDRSSKGRNEEL